MKGLRRLGVSVAVVLAALATTVVAPAHADPSSSPTPMWTVNGTVLAIRQLGNHVYAGGSFKEVGPPEGHAVVLDRDTAARNGPPLTVNGTVRAVASDGQGGWYLGGSFSAVNGVQRFNAARVSSTGEVLAWDPAPDGSVFTIARTDSAIVLGGVFTRVRNGPRANLAFVDRATGAAISTAATNTDGDVLSLDVSDDGASVYAGGTFTKVNNVASQRVVKLSSTTGAVDTTFLPLVNGNVNAVAYDPSTDRLYIGGTFTTAGLLARQHVAALDAPSGAIVATWSADTDGVVNALAVAPDGRVVIGGAFTQVLGQTRRYAAVVNRSGVLQAWTLESDGPLQAITMTPDGSGLYVGGAFSRLRSTPAGGAGLVALNGGYPSATFHVNANHQVRAIAVDDTSVVVGGEFTSLASESRANLVALDTSTGAPDPAAIPDADGAVRVLLPSPDGSTLYVGGDFTHIGATARNHLAAIDVATGQVTGFDPNVDGAVRALALHGTALYVGGTFSHIGGLPVLNLARVDLATAQLDVTFQPAPDRGVNAIAVAPDGETVFAGGAFLRVGALSRAYLASFDAQGLMTTWRPNVPKVVLGLQLLSDGSALFAGTGGQSDLGNNVIKYLPSGPDPELFRVHSDGDVQAISLSPDEQTLYVGGHMKNVVLPVFTHHVEVFAMSTADGTLRAFNPDLDVRNKGVWAIDTTASSVVLGGEFSRSGPSIAEGVALFAGAP
jgi:hypothetical protein